MKSAKCARAKGVGQRLMDKKFDHTETHNFGLVDVFYFGL